MWSRKIGSIFGWYMTGANATRADNEQNGKVCISGLAIQLSQYQGECVEVFKYKFNNTVIKYPYQCNPTDFSKKCTTYLKQFDTDDNSTLTMDVQCSCSLDGDTGYCGSVVGTDDWSNYLQNYRTLLANNRCHTLDKFNLKAYFDPCSNTPDELLSNVINQRFNLTYFPYMRAGKGVPDCIQKTFLDSFENLQLSRATSLAVSVTALLAIVLY